MILPLLQIYDPSDNTVLLHVTCGDTILESTVVTTGHTVGVQVGDEAHGKLTNAVRIQAASLRE